MWERLLEIALFARSGRHRATTQILKSIIHAKDGDDQNKITKTEIGRLKAVFRFLADCYSRTELSKTRFATDQTHFYTMATSLLASDFLQAKSRSRDERKLSGKLVQFAKMFDAKNMAATDRKLRAAIREYRQVSTKQTTHPGQREARQRLFLEIIALIK
jgi:hypothetical protein